MERPVAVIGGSNIDILGKSSHLYLLGTSNPGTVTKSPGGVGRNIAHTLSLLGVEVDFYTATGDDKEGELVLESLRRAGIPETSVIKSREEKTGVYVAIEDAEGNLSAAVSDMGALELLLPQTLEREREKLAASSMIVIDTNIPGETISWISEFSHTEGIPLFIEPVSTEKAIKLKELPHPAAWISPSENEFLELFGMPEKGFESLFSSFEESSHTHVRLSPTSSLDKAPSDTIADNIIVTVGSRGAMCFHQECTHKTVHTSDSRGLWCGSLYRPYPVEVINDNGAGDAFFGGFIAALWHEKSEEEAIRYGMASAARVLRSPQAVDEDADFASLSSYIYSHEMRD